MDSEYKGFDNPMMLFEWIRRIEAEQFSYVPIELVAFIMENLWPELCTLTCQADIAPRMIFIT